MLSFHFLLFILAAIVVIAWVRTKQIRYCVNRELFSYRIAEWIRYEMNPVSCEQGLKVSYVPIFIRSFSLSSYHIISTSPYLDFAIYKYLDLIASKKFLPLILRWSFLLDCLTYSGGNIVPKWKYPQTNFSCKKSVLCNLFKTYLYFLMFLLHCFLTRSWFHKN